MKIRAKSVWWWGIVPLLIVGYASAVWGISAHRWYQPKLVMIADAPQGTDPMVSIDRVIKRTFDGQYTVSVWSVPPDGHVACAGSDTLRYKGGLYRPHAAPLSQWADDPWCARLAPGEYYAAACWTVLRPFWGLVPAKTTCINSAVFRILSADPKA